MTQPTYYCPHCDYLTDHKAKYNRHLETLKHQIAVHGIDCCGLQYRDKHKWVNHKKSRKHNHLRKVILKKTEELKENLEFEQKVLS